MDEFAAEVLGACIEEFGVSAVYSPAAGAPFDLRGVFDTEHRAVELGGEGVISTSALVFEVGLAGFPADAGPSEGDGILIGAVYYRVADVQKDGRGGAKLILHSE